MSPEEPVSPGRKLLLAAGGACLLLALSISAPVARGQPAPTTRIDSLLAEMTVEEKLGQLAQYTGQWATTGPEASADQEALIRDGAVGSFLNIYGAEETCRLQRMAVEESRLGIPLLFAYDVVHGFRTVFPMPLAMASSWNPSMARRAARVGAMEASAAGVHWTFAPMLDVTREPRWGRIMESFGEDPYLSSVMARAGVEGFQGDDLSDPRTLLSTAKHYVAYGAPQAGRDYNTVDLSRRTLREVFLPPFRAAADAGAASIMAAFNEVNGIPMHAHDRLINGVLRDEWGWNGLLVSDYTGVRELIQHGIAASKAEAGVKALRAGVDVDRVSGIYGDVLPEVARDGRLDEETVDRAVRRVLRAKHRAGLFEDPYRYCEPDREDANTLTDEHRRSARRVARESIVLLKNEGDLLPLSKDAGTIAVIGSLAVDRRSVLGEWAGAGRRHHEHEQGRIRRGGGAGPRGGGCGAGAGRELRHERRGRQPHEHRPAGRATRPGEKSLPDGHADGGRPHERSPAGGQLARRQRARHSGDVAPRHRDGERGGRRAFRGLQPGGEPAGDVPAQRRAGAHLLQSQEHGPPARREGLHLPVSEYAVDAALSVRARAELHDVCV